MTDLSLSLCDPKWILLVFSDPLPSSFSTPPNGQSPRYPLPAHRQYQPPLYQPETESSFVYSDGKTETGESMHGEFTYVTSSKSVNE